MSNSTSSPQTPQLGPLQSQTDVLGPGIAGSLPYRECCLGLVLGQFCRWFSAGGAQRQHGLFLARCICYRGWIVSCSSQSLIPTFALLDIAATKVRKPGRCLQSSCGGKVMLKISGRMYVSSLVFGVTSNLSALTLDVPRLDRLHPGSFCGCNNSSAFSSGSLSSLHRLWLLLSPFSP